MPLSAGAVPGSVLLLPLQAPLAQQQNNYEGCTVPCDCKAHHSTRSPPPPPSAKGWKNPIVPCSVCKGARGHEPRPRVQQQAAAGKSVDPGRKQQQLLQRARGGCWRPAGATTRPQASAACACQARRRRGALLRAQRAPSRRAASCAARATRHRARRAPPRAPRRAPPPTWRSGARHPTRCPAGLPAWGRLAALAMSRSDHKLVALWPRVFIA